ncbi:M20/M25/M40 family metallo-hydrolase [Urechidicola sp. KH5]
MAIGCTENKKEVITIETITKHLETLSSDEMQGRKPGTEGIEKAAQYIESEFERIGLKPFNGATDFRQRFSQNVRGEDLDLFNVIGMLEGKSKKDEYVIVSGHYDHLGIAKNPVEGDSIYNGANDDASGITGVLALAEHYKEHGSERSIVFIAFTAEELGLVGSNYFGSTINPKEIVAGINLEMIGKTPSFGPNTAWLTGFDRSDFGTIIQKNLKGSEFKLHPDPYTKFRLFFRSDNASLAYLGIPAHTFSTTAIDQDQDYHKVTDETETLDMQVITQTIKAVALGTESIINGKDTPTRVQLTDQELERLKKVKERREKVAKEAKKES